MFHVILALIVAVPLLFLLLARCAELILSRVLSLKTGVDVDVKVRSVGLWYLTNIRIRLNNKIDVEITEIRISSVQFRSAASTFVEFAAISIDVTGFHCDLNGFNGGGYANLVFDTELITINYSKPDGLRVFEVGVETLSFRRREVPKNDESSDVHFWGAAVIIGAGLAQFTIDGATKKLQVQIDEIQLEWDDGLLKEVRELLRSVLPKKLNETETEDDTPAEEEEAVDSSAEEAEALVIQVSIRNLDIYLIARKAGFLVTSIECLRIESPSRGQLLVWFDAVRLDEGLLGSTTGCTRNPAKACENFASLVSDGECARFLIRNVQIEQRRELFVHVDSNLRLTWSPLGYVILYEAITATKARVAEFKSIVPSVVKKRRSSGSPKQSPRPLVLNVVSDHPVEVGFRLPKDHLLQFQVPSIYIQKTVTDNSFSVNSQHLTIRVDGHAIVEAEDPLIRRLQMDVAMDMNRREFKQLRLRTNKVWSWTADSLKFHFPYGYNFADAYEEVINSVKFMKIVHGKQRQPFTADSPLPCDLHIAFKLFTLQMDDDPFEVQLQTNYELMVDEVYECERRREMLEKKLQDYAQRNFYVTAAKEAELFEALKLRNAKIYVERARQLRATRSQLFVWDVRDVEIRAFADSTLHGERNVVRLIREFNPESPPPNPLRFSTLWARCFELNMGESRMHFRDYPLPYTQFVDAYFWGHLVGAEHLPDGNRSMRDAYVELPEPWGTYHVERNMCPLKFFYDLGCEMTEFSATYGPCWEPCLTMISLCWNLVNAPSRDPSPILPFWDKIRMLLHGRFSMICKKFVTSMLASPDPYNSTELVDISWENFGFDWTTGVFRITTDVNTYVRTASKYDDSRLLQLPGFKCTLQLEWICMAKQHDHYSVYPCAPDKLPEYSANEIHDSYRAFRSSYVNVTLNVEVKKLDEIPQILLYSNTLKWLDYLKNTLTIQNRPIKRGALFGTDRVKKSQMSRHYKHVQINISLPKFYISYWMSFSSSHGFRLISNSMNLTSSLQLHIIPHDAKGDNIQRRPTTSWKVSHVSVQMDNCQIHLFGDAAQPTASWNDDADTFFVGLERLSYVHEQSPQRKPNLKPEEQQLTPNHLLTVHDLRASWTVQNRDTCLAIADGVQKAHVLKKILSTNALRNLNLETLLARQNKQDYEPKNTRGYGGSATSEVERSPARVRAETLNSVNQSCSFDAEGILAKLVDEAGTKLVAYSEETVEPPSENLHGVTLCDKKDVIAHRWQIDLLNCQAILKSYDRDGFVLLTAARASVKQLIHQPVWRHAQLLAKKSWSAALSGMQYFAPQYSVHQNPSSKEDGPEHRRKLKWLPRSVIDEKVSSAEENSANDHIDANLDSYLSIGEAVGGIVSGGGPPLQRVVSRCSCQLFFCYFNDSIDLDLEASENHLRNWPPADRQKSQPQGVEWGGVVENVDCFTLKHNMLEVSTNPEQYQMILDIVNNLVLFVDPKKKESEKKRTAVWFKYAEQSLDVVRSEIENLQSGLRSIVARTRAAERELYFQQKIYDEARDSELLRTENDELRREITALKNQQYQMIDDLAMTISCYKEKEVEHLLEERQQHSNEEEFQVVARRFEVCFEDCAWKLTEVDGQIILSEMQIRDFLYTRTARINNSGDHLLEIGTVKVINRLPDANYLETLARLPQPEESMKKQPSIRVICRDLAPVGGISVKEHFEVNVVPMNAQITYKFFDKMMSFFFPGKDVHEPSKDSPMVDGAPYDVTSQASSSISLARRFRGAVNGSFRKSGEQLPAKVVPLAMVSDIDKMRERAEKNIMFVYIKIPEVPFIVSYKGSKEKNIEDVDRFQMVFPLCEYHYRNWTWLDLALAVKQRCRRVLLQQFMKQKFLRNKASGSELSNVEPIDEEQKKRIVLGTAIMPEKKKSKKG
uniref:Fmp27_GFWDK domain-containing protein n=1 Tax=Steinernema glaseri TaxID=37863 RepID=A0A1I7Y709_9BILA